MAELAKCPICSPDSCVTRFAANRHNPYGIACACGLQSRLRASPELAVAAWNSLCETIRVGREVFANIPEDREPHRVGYSSLTGHVTVDTLARIPAPLSKVDVLRECKVHIGYRSGVERRLQSKIDAVLEAEE